MYDNDDIMKRIDDLHGETTEEIKEINKNIAKLDKKVDIHIEVAKAIENKENKGKLTRNQKLGVIFSVVGVSLALYKLFY